MTGTLDMALIGNCQVAALIDSTAEIVWFCLPRFDGDPVFCSLFQDHQNGTGKTFCSIELVDQIKAEQSYLPNSAVLVTRHTGIFKEFA